MVRRLLLVTALLAGTAPAEDYSFSVPRMECNTSIESDGSFLIYYSMDFECETGAHDIDIVDIGFPTSSYDAGSVTAAIDGQPVSDIRPSTVIPVGVEVHLGDLCIRPGHSGTFTLSGNNPGLIYADPSEAGYASLEFTPTWFDASFLTGTTHMVLRLQFPPGADSASVRYHGIPFTDAWMAPDGRMIYEWESDRWLSSSYQVGVSFPSDLVTCEVSAVKPYQGTARMSSGGGADIGDMIPCICPTAFVGLFVGIIVLGVAGQKRRRLQYIKPSIGVEGVGIKRGLTVPQVGVLLGQKLDRILMLIIYGLVRKGAVTLDTSSGRPVFGSVDPNIEGLQDYDIALLKAIRTGKAGKDALDVAAVKDAFVALVKDIEAKMKGFSVRETREYYRSIMSEAWKQLRAAAGAEGIEAVVAEQLPWLLLEDRVEQRLGEMPELRNVILYPTRLGGSYRPVFSSGQGMNIQQFCSDVAGRLENTASSLLGNVDGFTSSVTAVTNPIPVSSYSSGRSGGGCACACACAGCACACAGGGR